LFLSVYLASVMLGRFLLCHLIAEVAVAESFKKAHKVHLSAVGTGVLLGRRAIVELGDVIPGAD
jgi:hypothetical protein